MVPFCARRNIYHLQGACHAHLPCTTIPVRGAIPTLASRNQLPTEPNQPNQLQPNEAARRETEKPVTSQRGQQERPSRRACRERRALKVYSSSTRQLGTTRVRAVPSRPVQRGRAGELVGGRTRQTQVPITLHPSLHHSSSSKCPRRS